MNAMATSIEDYLRIQGSRVHKELTRLVPPSGAAPAELYAAARHALLGAGKRLRPVMTLSACSSLGGDTARALIPACALEMVHTYSLIHDDLPCMDDDDLRRGIPTVHRAFGEWQAVLAGDFLLTKAFSLLAEAPHLTAAEQLELIRVLSKAAGDKGMIAGQFLDLQSEGRQLAPSDLAQLHTLKTGTMICAALDMGALIAGASSDDRAELQKFGQCVGLAFQVVDDILDVTDSSKKGRSSDLANDKVTYVSLLGMQRAQEEAKRLHTSACAALANIDCDTSILNDLAQYVLLRKS